MTPANDRAAFSIAAFLAQHHYFRGIDPSALGRLGEAATRRRVERGAMLFFEGEPSAGLWVIEAGRVKIFKVNVEGREHILHLLGPGDSFNDVAAVDGGPNPVNAAALSDLIVWVIPSARLQEFLADYPPAALSVAQAVSQRLRGAIQQIEDLALYSVQARMARFLLSQAEDPSLRGPAVTRAAIAAHLATTPETVSRVLRSLEEAGAIRFDRHRIMIVDEELLRGLAYM